MAYFLKKTTYAKGLYLQIYESFRDPETKQPKHKSIKKIGYIENEINKGIKDPIAYYQKEVDKMNKERQKQLQEKKVQKITNEVRTQTYGHFLLKAVMNKIKVQEHLQYFNLMHNFNFRIEDLLESLVYARVVDPCSKYRTYTDVLPLLAEMKSFSLDQIYEGVEFMGSMYERVIETFNHNIKKTYGRRTNNIYFDCTNYYFEIDQESEDKQKGPSKENQKGPIISMALMLDADQLPIGMKMFPGNQSEKPELREMIKQLKEQQHIVGKTIQVADKGLNCAANIVEALLNHDGYIFSKSVKGLSEEEKQWIFDAKESFVDVRDSEGNIRYRYKEKICDFDYTVKDIHGKNQKVALPEKRVLTFNPKLAEKQKKELYKLMDKAVNLTKSRAKRNEYGEAGKYVTFVSVNQKDGNLSDGKDVIAIPNQELFLEDLKYAGFNLLVTSETKMDAEEIYSVYHNLWKIEETFRILKSQLDARPVYLQKRESIYGHFLICYLSVLLLRILEIKEFDRRLNVNSIISFIRSFNGVVLDQKKTIYNTATDKTVRPIEESLHLNLDNQYFDALSMKKLFNYKF